MSDPTARTALVFGRRYAELDLPARLVGAVLESNDFYPGRCGRDHPRVLASAGGIPLSRVDQVLDVVKLSSAAGQT